VIKSRRMELGGCSTRKRRKVYIFFVERPAGIRLFGRRRRIWKGYIEKYLKQEILGKTNSLLSFHYILIIFYDMDCPENIVPNNFSGVACVFIAARTCLRVVA
jgi:hypothetical protein